MCGRIQLTSPAQVIAETFDVEPPDDLVARWNIAPGQTVLTVRVDREGRRGLLAARWGLVPRWSATPQPSVPMINARSETVATSPAFREAFRARRCLVPASAFYEWQALPGPAPIAPRQGDLFAAPTAAPTASPAPAVTPSPRPNPTPPRSSAARATRRTGPRQPFVIRLPEQPVFAIAGLWETWRPRGSDASTERLVSCTLLTTTPNELMAPIHDRMPVILPRSSWEKWLDPEAADDERLLDLLRPYRAEEMSARPVSTWVNDPRHDDPRCEESAPG